MPVHRVESFQLSPIRNERQYRHAVAALNALLEDVGDDESHPLYALPDTLGVLIHEYEEERHRLPDVGVGEKKHATESSSGSA